MTSSINDNEQHLPREPRGEQSQQSGSSPPPQTPTIAKLMAAERARAAAAEQSASTPPSMGIAAKALAVNPDTAIDTVTVLRTIGPLATKTWKPDGDIKGYDDAALFTVSTRPINSLLDLAAVLREIEDDPRSLAIRGHLRDDAVEIQCENLPAWNGKRAQHGKPPLAPRDGQFARRAALFEDVAHRWVMLDVDGYKSSVDPVSKPEAAIREFIATKLPPEFHYASCHWQLSSSAGHAKYAGVLKAHIWFWLREPATSDQLKSWASAKALPVDLSVFNTVQVHYTAAPVFAAGAIDPVARRSGYCDLSPAGDDDVVLVLPEAKPQRAYGRLPQDANAEPLTDEQIDDFTSALAVLDADDRDTWIHVILNCNPWPELHEPVRAWSATSSKHTDDAFDEKWGETGDRGHWKAVLAVAQTRGWDNPARARHSVPTADGFENLRADEGSQPLPTAVELTDKLRNESREIVVSTWAARAVHLTRSEAEEVKAEVGRLTGIGPRSLQASLTEARETAKRLRAQVAFERDVAGRKVIEVEKGELGPTAAAAEDAVLARAQPGEYVVFGGRLSRVAERELPFTHLIDAEDGKPPVVPVIVQLAPTEVEVVVGKAAVFVSHGLNGQRVREHVPQRVVDHLMAAPSKSVPQVSGLISHPVVMPSGEIVAEDGLHARSRLFLHGAKIDGLRPYTQPEAAAALARLREGLFAEFEFASDADADVAVASLITAAQRRVMDSAPGLAVLASRQSSGKTTLARVLHLVVTGRDLPVTTLADDESETQKRLLALLMRSPEVVCIDNVPDGFTFRSASLSAAMTSGELHQRVLGESREASVPTTVMFVITGNNLTLGADEVTRWMPCRLAPKGARPEERRFRRPDVVGSVLHQRDSVLRDVVGIVAGFLASGAPMPSAGTRFNTWDKVVRAPLIWAGASDVAEVFRRNREESADEQAQVALLLSLRDLFDGGEFPAVEVAKAVRVHESNHVMPGNPSARLVDALAQGRVGDIKSVKAVGRALGAVADRVVEVDGHEIVLRKRLHHGVALYRVEGGPPKLEPGDVDEESLL